MPQGTAFSGAVSHAWPGLDRDFEERAVQWGSSKPGEQFQRALNLELARARGRISPWSAPVLVRREHGAKLRQLASAYYRSIEAIVHAWNESEDVRRVIVLPPELGEIVENDPRPACARVHLCRLDLLLQEDGGYHVVETNANCPGGLASIGSASREWRPHLSEAGLKLPEPLEHEAPNWMATWYLQTAEAETGEAPDFVVLLRWDGGNRLELPGLASELAELGVEAREADPRELEGRRGGSLSLDGRVIRHAYWKLGMEGLRRHAGCLKAFLEAVRARALFVQNGVAGRFVGDSKLCLAVLSDPRFAALFEPDDLALIAPHIPWSRNAALCTSKELRNIRAKPADYVLKRSLDTQGQGVVIGREVGEAKAWAEAVERAVQGAWLVQRFCPTTLLQTEHSDGRVRRHHDLALGLAEGRLIGAMCRSSSELRTNVALTGSLHPVFMET